MASTSGLNKRVKGKDTSSLSKRQCTAGNSNTIIIIPEEESQWISNNGKTSFVWNFFQAKTNGRAYCRYKDSDNNEECGYSCVYKTQTSSMLYHINNTHKKFEKKAEVSKFIIMLHIFYDNIINFKLLH